MLILYLTYNLRNTDGIKVLSPEVLPMYFYGFRWICVLLKMLQSLTASYTVYFKHFTIQVVTHLVSLSEINLQLYQVCIAPQTWESRTKLSTQKQTHT